MEYGAQNKLLLLVEFVAVSQEKLTTKATKHIMCLGGAQWQRKRVERREL